MIVWGGGSPPSSTYNTGGIYDPTSDLWNITSIASGVPIARGQHSAVWTGNEMIVWGGYAVSGSPVSDGGHYDPIMDTWTASTLIGAPSSRYQHTAVWTGSEMIVWGGEDATHTELGDGKRYRCVP
jgi:hypothetical protein